MERWSRRPVLPLARLLKHSANLSAQDRKIPFDNVPYAPEIDAKILMHHHVPESDGLAPGDLGVLLLQLL